MPKISQNAEVVKIGKWIKERRESLRRRVPKRAKESKTWRLQIWYTEVVKVHKYAVWKGARHVLPYL